MILTYPTQNLVKKNFPSHVGCLIWQQRYGFYLERLYYQLGEICQIVKIILFNDDN